MPTDETLIREQITDGNMDHQPAGDTAKTLVRIIDLLRAENAALKAKCEDLTAIEKSANAHHGKDGGKLIVPDDPLSRATYWKARAQSAKGQLATLTERNAALEKDRERLDWLESKKTPGISTHWHTGLAFMDSLRHGIDEAIARRAAIDAALARNREGEE